MRNFSLLLITFIASFSLSAQCVVSISPDPVLVCPSQTAQLTVNVSGNFLKK